MEDHDKVKAEPSIKAEPPKTEPPKAEPPKAEPPKAEPPKAEPPKAEPPKAEPPAKADPLDTMVDRWFADHFYGSVVARDVDTYNHVYLAVEELKKRLRVTAGAGVN